MLRSPLESQFVIRVGDLSDGVSLQDLDRMDSACGRIIHPGEQTTKNVFILWS